MEIKVMEKPKLIIIEGFDRVGKDTFLKQLKEHYTSINKTDACVYIQNLPKDMPHYRKNPLGFKKFLEKYIDDQINELIELSNNGYKSITMTRLFVSDYVYSHLFNRESVVHQFVKKVQDHFEIEHFYMTFKDYNEYLNRLKMINDNYIEYSEEEFNKISNLYDEALIYYDKIYKMKIKSYLKMDANSKFNSQIENF